MRRISRAVSAAAMEALESRRLLAESIWAYPGLDGKLLYKPLPLGDKIQDFTNVGYRGGTAPIPDVSVKITVSPVAGDDTTSIQAAIDAVEAMPLDANGFRGAVLLNPGTYEIASGVTINTSGVILRGSGQNETMLIATGTEKDTLIRLSGNGGRATVSGTTKNVTDKYVPVGAISFTVSNTTGLAVGDSIMVHRPTTANWIHDIGMDRLTNPWTSRNVDMDRTITRIDGNVITIDAPITHALDQNYGGGTIWKYTSNRLANVGVEYLTGESTFDPALLSGSDRIDENHAEHMIGVAGVINGWVRNVTSKYFGYSCVNMTGPSKWITVQDSQCLDPVSVVTGGRRYSFNMGDSTNVLWKNLYTRDGRHDYVQGSEVTGPNVVVDSRADKARADTGPHHRYSTGTLWDNLDVNGNAINIQNRWNSGTGHGWAGANQVVWNSEANSFIIQNIGYPLTSSWNWAIGNIGTVNNGNLTNGGEPTGTQGFYDSHGTKVDTRSLFHAQMAEKLAHENWMLREVRIGDADNYVSGNAADTVAVDAAWKTAVQNASGKTGVGFDNVANNQLVPFTFNFGLEPGTYVVGASVSLGVKSAGNDTSGDTLYFENAGRTYTWAELGVAAPDLSQGAAVVDLSPFLAALQDGKLNLAVSGNTAIDWATLNFQTASIVQPRTTAMIPTDDAYVDAASPTSNFGGVTSLYTKLNGAGDVRESYLKFDLSSLAGSVASAYVRIVPTSVGYNATTFGSGIGAMFNRISFVSSDTWTEGAINWNNRPAADPFFREFLSYTNEPLSFDVTSLVRAAQAGDKKLSLKLNSYTEDDNSQITFASSENSTLSFRPQLFIRTLDVSPNLKPMITPVPRITGNLDAPTAAQWFGVWDAETPAGSLTVTATSSNTTLLPNANISFGGSGMDRTFTLTPAAGQFGASTVTLTVTDAQGQSTSTTFQYLVENLVALNGDQNAQNQDDVFRVIRNGSFLDIFRNDMVTPIVHVNYASAAKYLINAMGGQDQVLIDLAGGDPLPAVGIGIDGGAGNDLVRVIGSAGADAVALSGGDIVIGSSTAEFSGGIEELHLILGAGADTLAAGGNASVSTGVVLLEVTGGGTLSMAAASTLPDFTDVIVNGATFNLNGQNQTIDALSGSGIVTNNGVAATLTVGQQGGSSTFGGSLTNGSGTLALTKNGAGTLTLSGANSFTGLSTINAGVIASGNASSFAGLSGQVRFNGGIFHVTANTVAANVANKFTTSFAGATVASTGTFDIDAGATLTIGGSIASLQTNGGGAHGGRFAKTGAGTLRILGNNGQLDDPLDLHQGTVITEASRALGGADNSNNRVEMKSGTTLILRQDSATDFLTPISAIEAGAVVNVVVDRQSPGAGVTHALNAFSSAGSFTLNVSAGANITSSAAGLTIGSATLAGNGTFNIANGASAATTLTIGGSIAGAFDVTKIGSGTLALGASLTTSPAVTVAGGRLALLPGGDKVIKTNNLSITGGAIDIADNKLIAANTLGFWNGIAYTGMLGYIDAGRGPNATWNGSGLMTSMPDAQGGSALTSLGISSASVALGIAASETALWAGQTVLGSDVLVMYTFAGDATLDGKINIDDYGRIDANVGRSGSVFGWHVGDFNYDGKINVDDYGIIDGNVNAGLPPFV